MNPKAKDEINLDFRALFQGLPGLYLILSPDLNIVAVSDSYLRATMTRREQILGRNIFEVFPDNPDDPHATGERNLGASLTRVLQNAKPDTMPVQKYDIRRPESEGGGYEERFWSPLNSPLLDEQGNVRFIIHRVEDVTDFVRLKNKQAEKDRRFEEMEAEVFHRGQELAEARASAKIMRENEFQLRALTRDLEQARNTAESASHAKDQFLAMLSHELRTPLTPALLTVSMLEANSEISPEVHQDLETIRQNVELEARLIDDLLDLTRVQRGQLKLKFERVDAHKLIQSALAIACPDRKADIEVRLEAGEHHVNADAARFQQIFWNLISNACKFTPQGKKIRVRSWNDGTANNSDLMVEVADEGVGIDDKVLPGIFDAFKQADSSLKRDFGGLGLGLAIGKALVDAHNGQITAHSDGRNQGSRFVLTFPTVSPFAAAAQAPIKRKPADALAVAVDLGARLKILLVEDHAATLTLMSRLLRDLGHEVFPAQSLQAARALADQEDFDLLISDLGLPDGSGNQLMRELKSKRPTLAAAIAISGYGTPEDIRQSLAAGFAKHLTKPINLEKLQAAITQVAKT